MKRRRRGDAARDETSPESGFDHSSHHADLASLLEEHSYGVDAEVGMRAWIDARRRPEGGSAEPPPRSRDELRSILGFLESADAQRADRQAGPVRPQPRAGSERVIAPR